MWLMWTLLACVGFGVGSAMQKHGMATRLPNLSLAGFIRDWRNILRIAVRNWIWLLGVAVNLAGGGCMVLAVHAGEISVVQPLINVNVLIAMMLGVVVLGERLLPSEWAGAAVLLLGAVLLSQAEAGMANGSAPATGIPDGAALWITLACLAAVTPFLFFARTPRGLVRPEAYLAISAGLLFGLGTVYLKILTMRVGQLADGPWADLIRNTGFDWPLWGIVATNIIGFILYQAAFSYGRVAIVSPLTTNASILLPVVAGVVSFGESAGLAKMAGVGIVAAGTTLLFIKPMARKLP